MATLPEGGAGYPWGGGRNCSTLACGVSFLLLWDMVKLSTQPAPAPAYAPPPVSPHWCAIPPASILYNVSYLWQATPGRFRKIINNHQHKYFLLCANFCLCSDSFRSILLAYGKLSHLLQRHRNYRRRNHRSISLDGCNGSKTIYRMGR